MSALISGDRRLSQAALQERAAKAAGGFRALGIGIGDVVALYMRNDFAFFEASLGAGLAGAYATPINWHFTAEETAYILQDSEAKVLVVHGDLWPRIAGIVPENRPEGETYEVQRFTSLENSVAAYMRNLNTKTSYREFRDRRAAMRERGDMDSYQLAGHLQRYSIRGADYIRTIRSIMRSNNLELFDAARLMDEPAPLFSNIDFFGKS